MHIITVLCTLFLFQSQGAVTGPCLLKLPWAAVDTPHRSRTWWHSCTITPQASHQPPWPTWQRLKQCWHFSCLSGLILWLRSHGVRPVVAMATPACANRAQGGAATPATHQHLDFLLNQSSHPLRNKFDSPRLPERKLEELWEPLLVTVKQ